MKTKYWLLCAAFMMTACAGKSVFKDEFDDEKIWFELQAQLPSYPKPENLIFFDIGPISSHRHYIDETSIQVGDDGVIRYSLVIEPSSKVMNVSFEGLRCATKERKRYALGRSDGTWSQSHLTEWQRLENITQDYAQQELFKYYFCPLKSIVGSPQEAIRALKAGIHPKVKSLHQ